MIFGLWLVHTFYSVITPTAVQIIWIWKWKQNIWRKTFHTWIQISPEQEMVETSCKKILEQGSVIEYTDWFHFTQLTEKKLPFLLKNWEFSTFTTFSLHPWRSVDVDLSIFSLFDVRNEVVFLILENSSLRGQSRKKNRRNIKFWPLNSYYKRSDWKIGLSERYSEALISKPWNKTNTCSRS